MTTSEKDMESLDRLEELVQESENEVQKAVSLVKLNTGVKEAFEDVFKNIDLMSEMFISMDDDLVRLIALSKINDFITNLEENIALL